jgi:hypothetical protein
MNSIFNTVERAKRESPEPAEIKRIFDLTRDQMTMPGPGEYKNTDAAFMKKDY